MSESAILPQGKDTLAEHPSAPMNWPALLAPQRLGRLAAAAPTDGLRTDFFKDWDRIIFCSAFRRLQDKTQVQPLAKSDYVRTRLTHTLEVASVGRSLGMMAGQAILQGRPALASVVSPQDVGAIVAAAALMHDIGNPPFGHAGEVAIRAYFAGRGAYWLDGLAPQQKADFLHFDGNAQGLRTVVRLQHPDQPGGLQLTLPTLGAFCKYPRAAWLPAGEWRGASGQKPGFMDCETALFTQLAEGLGLLPRPGAQARAWFRHPLAFLVEAADDICYGVVDIEDGVKSGHISLDELFALHAPFAGAAAIQRARTLRDPQHRAEYLRAITIGVLVQQAADSFLEHHEQLLAARFDEPLVENMAGSTDFLPFKALGRDRLYTERSKAELQLAGFKIIANLLHTFCEAVELKALPGARVGEKSALVLRLLPHGDDVAAQPSRYDRLLAVTDFVAGMTDSYALDTHHLLQGAVP
jgi:dGTPase